MENNTGRIYARDFLQREGYIVKREGKRALIYEKGNYFPTIRCFYASISPIIIISPSQSYAIFSSMFVSREKFLFYNLKKNHLQNFIHTITKKSSEITKNVQCPRDIKSLHAFFLVLSFHILLNERNQRRNGEGIVANRRAKIKDIDQNCPIRGWKLLEKKNAYRG